MAEVPFHLLIYPRALASRIESAQDAVDYAERSRAPLMIFGTARLRTHNGQEVHVINLRGLARHGPLPEKVRKQFEREFSKVLPPSRMFPQDSDFLHFNVEADWIDLITRYVAGVIATASGHFSAAVGFYESILQRSNGSKVPERRRGYLRSRAEQRLVEALEGQIEVHARRYYLAEEGAALEQADRVADQILRLEKRNYRASLAKATAHFVLRRDLGAAKTSLLAVTHVADSRWRYSLGFLHAYAGRLNEVRQYYREARNVPRNPQTLLEVEQFIHRVLQEEPGRYGLHFALGILNFYDKEDLEAAHRDFSAFLSSVPGSDHLHEQKYARRILTEISRTIARESAS